MDCFIRPARNSSGGSVSVGAEWYDGAEVAYLGVFEMGLISFSIMPCCTW